MKQLPVLRAAAVLLAPVLIIACVTFLPLSGCGGGGGGAPGATATPGSVVIGLTDSPSDGFQHILLNVVSVRLNQSQNPTVSDTDPNWMTIPVPAGMGAVGDLQIDLNQLQGNAILFNTGLLPAQRYFQVELQIDQNTLGSIVPSCPQAVSPAEGCISYPIAFPGSTSSFLRATIPGGLTVTASGVTPLVIDVTVTGITPPSSSSGFYTVTPAISVVADPGSFLGSIKGTAGGGQTVTAVQSGTSTVIASATAASGAYTLQLPAGPNGTFYDIFSGGAALSTVAIQGIKVIRGGAVPGQNLASTGATIGSLSGNIKAATGGVPIQGATLNLLLPPQNNPGANCVTTPASCVAVGTSSTDNSGNFPLPGTAFTPASFTVLQIRGYTLQVNASGFTPIFTAASAGNSGTPGTCTGSSSTVNCSLALMSNTISGTVTVDVPPASGSSTQVLIAAEDAGTNNLESVALATIPAGATSAPFTINVPIKVPPIPFDLIASAQDLYQGNPGGFPGHTLAIAMGVTPGGAPVSLGILNCSGHGTVGGFAGLSDPGTTVRISQAGVQLSETTVGLSGTSIANQYSFCVPPGAYSLQRYENGIATGTPLPVSIATPASQATPCPTVSNCGTSSSCFGPCVYAPNSNL